MQQAMLDALTNPAKCRLLIEIMTKGEATASQLAAAHPDISQATLYRYLNRMLKDDLLSIKAENRIRGTVEKVYTVNLDMGTDIKEKLEQNCGEVYMQLFSQFVMGLMGQFQEYCRKPDIDIRKDGSGFTTCPVYATDEELLAALTSIGNILCTLTQQQPGPGRKMHSIAVITTPPQNGEML